MSQRSLRLTKPLTQPDNAAETALGRRVRFLRRVRRITLQDLASKTGLSIGLISQIERGLSSPSVKSLVALGEALGVGINWFFDDAVEIDAGEEPLVVRREVRSSISMPVDSIRKELLSPNQDRPLQLFMLTIEPGGGSGPEPYAHGGEVAGFILSGSLLMWIGERRFLLRAGDSFAIPSHRPRRYENPDQMQETKIVWSIAYLAPPKDAPRKKPVMATRSRRRDRVL